jgi:hypothetical protein
MKVQDLLLELKSFVAAGVTQSDLDVSKNSNAKVPGELLDAWVNGEYDEDPSYLVNELLTIIKMYNHDKETRRIYG